MMLSLSAARLGMFSHTAPILGKRSARFKLLSSRSSSISSKGKNSAKHSIWVPRRILSVRNNNKNVSSTFPLDHGHKTAFNPMSALSTKASFSTLRDNYTDENDDEDGNFSLRSKGHEEAATSKLASSDDTATPMKKSIDESWMINLGRDGDNEWLTGPRDENWFTGLSPNDGCPGTDAHGSIRSLSLPNLSNVTREAAKDYFQNSWALYECLFAGLKGEEGFYRPPPHGLRHPQIFYFGHTACLYVNKLRVSGVLSKPVNAYFESIFEIGVDEMLWDDMDKNDMFWPAVNEVHKYRQQVYNVVLDTIMNHPALEPREGETGVKVDQSHPMWALFMGYEHERIHLETSSVLFRETMLHLVQRPQNWPPLHPSAHKKEEDVVLSHPLEGVDYPANRMIAVNGNHEVDLGKPADFPSYGWDNEYGERNVKVPPFQASEHMITNGEYWYFVNDGGYRNKEHWCDDGWSWRTHRNMKWPFFWNTAGPAGSHQYHLRTVFEIVGMPWDWPVDVTNYEAHAYCRWKTAQEGSPTSKPYRVLTEAEHHIIRPDKHNLEAARIDASADKVMVTSGEEFTSGETASNLNLAYSSQNPVDYFPPSQSGHRDTTGNAWEWTEDHFNPLKGFEVHHVYDDFSSPCFDGKHSMIVGGSFISTGDEASVYARFHFRPHFLQHSGFRLVASDDDAPATHLYAGNFEGQVALRDAALAAAATAPAEEVPDSSTNANANVYETNDSLHMYLGLHYPTSGEQEGVPAVLPHTQAPDHGLRFPQRVANLLTTLQPLNERSTSNRALDIGCAVGGSSFKLAESFDHVDAFDFSESFVNAAKRMQSGETITFDIPTEAELYDTVEAKHEKGITQDIRSKVNFFPGDAQKVGNLPELNNKTYDGIMMSNLLCRLPDPMQCLDGLPKVVNKNGVVVIVTPFSWLLEFTPRSKWLGGFDDPVSKDPIRSKDVLQEIMEGNGFEKIHEEEMPLIIREHQRKYQYIISEATGWRKM